MTDDANDDFEIIQGSGNLFRDLGFPDADFRQAKALLAAAIIKTLDARQWSTRKAEQETGINHADFARIRNVKLDRFSFERLVSILSALGQDVELDVKVHPRQQVKAPAGLHP